MGDDDEKKESGDEQKSAASHSSSEDKEGKDEKKQDSGFKPITSQDDLDTIITSRLRRQEKALKADLKKELADEAREKEAEENGNFKVLYEEAMKKLKKFEEDEAEREMTELKAKVAKDVGLPESLIPRLMGDDEDALKKDAKKLLEDVGPSKEDPDDIDAGNSNKPRRRQRPDDGTEEVWKKPDYWLRKP